MEIRMVSPDLKDEFETPERCHILESWNDHNDSAASIARARVVPGVTTQLHRLRGVDERYLIIHGAGDVKVGEHAIQRVKSGDVLFEGGSYGKDGQPSANWKSGMTRLYSEGHRIAYLWRGDGSD